jgi:hypothetical protein
VRTPALREAEGAISGAGCLTSGTLFGTFFVVRSLA